MKNRRRSGTTALWMIGLLLLFTVLSAILFAKVDSEMPMYEEGVNYERY